jgi:transcription antitermination factor NusG
MQEHWYALRVRERFEKVASVYLKARGYQQYLPTYHSRRRWFEGPSQTDLPLFPGYIFCKFDFDNRLPILLTPGVMSVVTRRRTALPVSAREMLAVQRIAASGLPYEPWPIINVGNRVRIQRGPLRDLQGAVVDVAGHYRLIVGVTIIERAMSVEIHPDWVGQDESADDTVYPTFKRSR